MPSVKVSTKHQIVVPSAARRLLDIRAGDRLLFEIADDAIILRRRPARASDRLRGLGRGLHGGADAVATVRRLRDELERPG